MDQKRRLRDIISAVVNPCRFPPKRDQSLQITSRPRTNVSRTQVLAIGIMSITLIAVLSTVQIYTLYGGLLFQSPTKYNTESLVIKFGEGGTLVWTHSIPIANRSSKILFDPGSISITECSSGGYALVSPVLHTHENTKKWVVYLCRLDDSGNTLWDRILDTLNIELGLSIVESPNGNLVIAGTSKTFVGNSLIRSVFTIYVDSTGTNERIHSYPELIGVWGHSMVSCSNGDIAIVGTTEIHPNNLSNVSISRFDGEGVLLWTHSIGGPLNDEGRAIAECEDGGFIVAGSTQEEQGNDDVYLIRTNSTGSVMWTATREDERTSRGLSVCCLDDGRYAVTGLRRPTNDDSTRALFLLVDSEGNVDNFESIQFDSQYRAYGYYDACIGHSITESYEGGFIIAGIVRHNRLLDDWHMMILRTDSNGGLLMNSTYDANVWATACSVVSSEDNGFVIAGVRIEKAG